MDANTKGTLLTKRDKIVERMYIAADMFMKRKETVTKDEFNDFLVTIRLIVNSELTEKGVERKWKE